MGAIGSTACANSFAVQQDRTVFIAQPPGVEAKTIDLTSRTDVSRHTGVGQNRKACRAWRSRVHK